MGLGGKCFPGGGLTLLVKFLVAEDMLVWRRVPFTIRQAEYEDPSPVNVLRGITVYEPVTWVTDLTGHIGNTF